MRASVAAAAAPIRAMGRTLAGALPDGSAGHSSHFMLTADRSQSALFSC